MVWQRDLAVSLIRVGEVTRDPRASLHLLKQASTIMDKLSSKDRPSTDQHELSSLIAKLIEQRRELANIKAR